MMTGVVSPAESAAPVFGGQVAGAIDRWVFVFMAAWFKAIVLAGFVPATIAVHALWSNEGWRTIVHQLVGAA
ncbi:MAG: hypothetical protein QM773_21125 [Hyphomonadaceae bacterium]